MRKITLDIETTSGTLGAFDPNSMNLTVACIHDSETDQYTSYTVEQLPQLWQILERADHGTVLIQIEKAPKNILCSVQDEGKGISKNYLSKIFDRFFQVDAGQKGTGIGLTIAKIWIEAHGGQIWAESEGEGKGTTIKFTLPL
jgi:signal transduction histidine kinase